MWYVKNKDFGPEEEFISQVQLLAEKYKVEVEIDWKEKMIKFLTDDDELQTILAIELSDLFSEFLA